MNRNNEAHFNEAPTVGIQRSGFPISFNHKTTFNLGQIIPFYVDMDILPGDTWKLNCSYVIRLSTPIKPFMDNLYVDTYFFACPWRLVWEHTKEFFGENTYGAWSATTEYVIPQLETPTGGAAKGTLMDYMGIPTGVAGLKFSSLAIRSYVLTYNQHFRDQNLIAPLTDYNDDTDRTASNTTTELGGLPCKAARFHDYFSSMLPEAQKGGNGLVGPVNIPVGTTAPVIGNGKALGLLTNVSSDNFFLANGGYNGRSKLAAATPTAAQGIPAVGVNPAAESGDWNKFVGVQSNPAKSGLIADLSQAIGATVNAQRLAFATQRILEQFARGGTRYVEIVKSFYHVTSPDARQQRVEYLGGGRQPLNVQQTIQTSATDNTSPQGNLAAYSHTVNSDRMFTKSFTEHTIILGLMVIRQDHTYNQGLAKQWSRRRLLDVYNPKLCHLGEQPVLNKQWYAQGPSAINASTGVAYDDEVAGYQEAWAEYRTKINRVSSAFRTTYAQTLDFWHLADNYSSMPVLSQDWLEESPIYLDRTLAVTSQVEDQFLADILVTGTALRPMSIFSVPGLLDHF